MYKIIAGVGTLIAIFLFLNNWKGSVAIIDTLSTNSINAVSVLQGRDIKIK